MGVHVNQVASKKLYATRTGMRNAHLRVHTAIARWGAFYTSYCVLYILSLALPSQFSSLARIDAQPTMIVRARRDDSTAVAQGRRKKSLHILFADFCGENAKKVKQSVLLLG